MSCMYICTCIFIANMCKTLRKIKPKGIAQGELPTSCTSKCTLAVIPLSQCLG